MGLDIRFEGAGVSFGARVALQPLTLGISGKRIGVIGHSLGGHNSLFVAAFDPRLRAVVSSCGFNAFPKYKNGDLTGAKGAATLFTVYVGQGSHLKTLLTTAPEANLVEAARKAAAG